MSDQLFKIAVPWLRRLVDDLSPRRPGFDPGTAHVGFVVDKVALLQVSPPILGFFPVSFIPPVLHYFEKRKKLTIFITGLKNKPQGCVASVVSAAGPFKKNSLKIRVGIESKVCGWGGYRWYITLCLVTVVDFELCEFLF
jgi:hypothetical protein